MDNKPKILTDLKNSIETWNPALAICAILIGSCVQH